MLSAPPEAEEKMRCERFAAVPAMAHRPSDLATPIDPMLAVLIHSSQYLAIIVPK